MAEPTRCPKCRSVNVRVIREVFGAGPRNYCRDCREIWAIQATTFYSTQNDEAAGLLASQRATFESENAAAETRIQQPAASTRDVVQTAARDYLVDDHANALAIIEQLRTANAELVKIARGAWHLLESLHAVRDGVPDESIRAMADALDAAIAKAERA